MKNLSRLFLFTVLFALSSCADSIEDKFADASADIREKMLFIEPGKTVNSLLVKFNTVPSESFLAELTEQNSVVIKPAFKSFPAKRQLEHEFGLDRWYQVDCDGPIENLLIERLAGLKEVAVVENNMTTPLLTEAESYPVSAAAPVKGEYVGLPFNDPNLSMQWNMKNTGNSSIAKTAYKGGDLNIFDVWTGITGGDPSIIVAVIDEGVKYSHPDLRQNMWTNVAELNGRDGVDDDGNGYIDDIYGYNFVYDGEITWDKKDDSGHGTHCAGIIAAVNNNNLGVSSVAGGTGKNDGVKIMSCQIFSGKQSALLESVANAIKYAADMGASIISCSFGYKGGSFLSDKAYKNYASIEADAIAYFEASKNNDVLDGGIAIFASGNDGDPYATYPGALNDIISVSSFGPDYLPAYYTNYGPGCNIVAPGGDIKLAPSSGGDLYASAILSTLPPEVNKGKDYGYMQGTSMACPHVSGVAALGIARLKQLGKTMTAKKFKELLVTSAREFDSRINGKKAYYDGSTLDLAPYLHKMGTGAVDTWLFLMKLEGVPSLLAKEGENQWLDMSKYFGTSSVNLTYLGVEVSPEAYESLGLQQDPYIKYGRLYIYPTKCGSAKMTIKAVGGGTAIGGDDAIGGMEISQEISIVVRSFKSTNGGWL